MNEIDAKLKEIEDFNNRNFKIDEKWLEVFADTFE